MEQKSKQKEKRLQSFFINKKNQRLTKRVGFYEARVVLFKDYKKERTLEYEELYQLKINNFLAKNHRILLKKKYDEEDLEKQFKQTNIRLKCVKNIELSVKKLNVKLQS